MTYPTSVNNQITDAVTQSNVKVVGEAPAIAMGTIYQTMAHSTGILFQNAVAAAQQQNTLAQAAANQGVMQIYSLDTTATAGATQKIGTVGTPDSMASMLAMINAFRPQQA
ncbi:RebB family R body protein [Neogemmobacter tilapiae]|uniref:RebB protein n=1 Tax=Neogemmobacter tilapiae TaxID=875041 RepID=A0A918TW57_9RHOB|nr:RebB family R body protein [Gemmobacter tilapiae]GHC64716.1 RebB protein [Gemmobacter tilapiae]